MDYEDYLPEDFDPEHIEFDDIHEESWDNEWDPYSDWVYEGEFTDTYDDYYDQF